MRDISLQNQILIQIQTIKMQRVATLARKDKSQFQRGKSYDRGNKSKKHKKQECKNYPNQILKQSNQQSLKQHKSVENYRTKSPLKRFLQLRLGDVYSSQLGQMLKLLQMQKKIKGMLQNGNQLCKRIQLENKIQFLKNQQQTLIHKVQEKDKDLSSDKNTQKCRQQRKISLISQNMIKIYQHMGGQVSRNHTQDTLCSEILRIIDNKNKALKSIFRQLQILAFGQNGPSQQPLTFKQILLKLSSLIDASKKNKQQSKDMMKKIVELEKINIKLTKDFRKVQQQFECLVQQKLLLDNRLDRTKGMVNSMEQQHKQFKKQVTEKLSKVTDKLGSIRKASKLIISYSSESTLMLIQNAKKQVGQFIITAYNKDPWMGSQLSTQMNSSFDGKQNQLPTQKGISCYNENGKSLFDQNQSFKQRQNQLLRKLKNLQEENNRINSNLLLLQKNHQDYINSQRQQNEEKIKQTNQKVQKLNNQLSIMSKNIAQKDKQLNCNKLKIQQYTQNLRYLQNALQSNKNEAFKYKQYSTILLKNIQQLKTQNILNFKQIQITKFGVKMILALHQLCQSKYHQILSEQSEKSLKKQQEILQSQRSFRDLLGEVQKISNEIKQKQQENQVLKKQIYNILQQKQQINQLINEFRNKQIQLRKQNQEFLELKNTFAKQNQVLLQQKSKLQMQNINQQQQNRLLIKQIKRLEQVLKSYERQIACNKKKMYQIQNCLKEQIDRYFTQLQGFQEVVNARIDESTQKLQNCQQKVQDCKSTYQQKYTLLKNSIIQNHLKNEETCRQYFEKMNLQFLSNSKLLDSVYNKSLDKVQTKISQLQKLYKLLQLKAQQVKNNTSEKTKKPTVFEQQTQTNFDSQEQTLLFVKSGTIQSNGDNKRRDMALNYQQVLQNLLQQLLFNKVYLSLQSKIKQFPSVQRQKLNRYRQKIAELQFQLSIIEKQRQNSHQQQFLTNQKQKKQQVEVIVNVHCQKYNQSRQSKGESIWNNIKISQHRQKLQKSIDKKQKQLSILVQNTSQMKEQKQKSVLNKKVSKEEGQNSHQKQIELPLFNFISQHPSQNSIQNFVQNLSNDQQKEGSLSQYGLWQFANQDMLNQEVSMVKAQLNRCIKENHKLRKLLNIQQLDLIAQEP